LWDKKGKIPQLVGYGKEILLSLWDIKGRIPQRVGCKLKGYD